MLTQPLTANAKGLKKKSIKTGRNNNRDVIYELPLTSHSKTFMSFPKDWQQLKKNSEILSSDEDIKIKENGDV